MPPAAVGLIPRPAALAGWLRRAPVQPTSLASLLTGESAAAEFRRIVRALFPEHEAAILGASHPGADREQARVWAFMERVGRRFPVYEL